MELQVQLLVAAMVLAELTVVGSWPQAWSPNSVIKIEEGSRSFEKFAGRTDSSDHFRLLLSDQTSMLLGAKNAVHNVSLADLQEFSRIDWEPHAADIELCTKKQKTMEQCQNYIRVIVKKKKNELFTCGTNAFRPRCRTYREEGRNGYVKKSDMDGKGSCPYDPEQNSTALYTDGKLFSATVSDFSAGDPLILETDRLIRTQQYDSNWLNEPNFVSSFSKQEKVFFFFRETAVEHINCGKAVFSRVARICKRDNGGRNALYNTWTSFFKARLNCSIPGDFPFYFDEIQATSDFGEGNFHTVKSASGRYDMIYAIFNTPYNSIHGSAVCAFSFDAIEKTFEGRFKGQESAWHNWLAVQKAKTPFPHPQKCANQSQNLEDTTLNFIKTHPLMDSSVPALGGAPLLVQTSFASKFTQIAIDWHVWGKDRYYDIMFIGTDDGRILKAVNTQESEHEKIKTVVIEDIQVLGKQEAIINLKVHRNGAIEKLIVISKNNVVSIPLHRCGEHRTCHKCVGLQDPYCSWAEGKCSSTNRGLQNIRTGKSSACGEEPGVEGGRIDSQREVPVNMATVETLAIAIVVSIILSMLVGFLIGYKVSACRASRDIDTPYQERNISLSKRSNRLSSGDHTYFNPDSPYKNFSYVVNVKTPGKLNTSVETKPVTKSNKVYL